MNLNFTLVRAGIAAMLVIGTLGAHFIDRNRSRTAKWIRGTVVQLDAAKTVLIVRGEDPDSTFPVHWNERTVFLNVDGPIHPEQTERGERVMVRYLEAKGNRVAERIEIEPVHREEA